MRMADTCLEAFKAIRIEFHFKKFNPYFFPKAQVLPITNMHQKLSIPVSAHFVWNFGPCRPHFQGGSAF